MKDFLKKGFYLGVGVFTLTKEKIEKVVDEMVHKGEADQADRASLIDEFMQKAQEYEEELTDKVKKIVQDYGYVPRKEFEQLKKRIEELEKKAAAKRPAAKKPASAKAASTKVASKKKTTGGKTG